AAEPPITGSVARGNALMPWPMPNRRATGDALAYAPATQSVEVQAGAPAKARYIGRASNSKAATTAVKSTRQTAKRPAIGKVKVGERINNPWMRAMMVAPNAQNFMSTSLYGAPDITTVREHMQ